jgi:uncharacterized protein (DUF1810 family)
MTADRHNLQRFLDAQSGVYATVLRELRQGRKQTHWMWFVFPQLEGLGHSAMARNYAISSLDEARAYLVRPVLGERLQECTRLVIHAEGRSIEGIFGHPDFLKFHSSMTLFSKAAAEEGEAAEGGEAAEKRLAAEKGVFDAALAKYFASRMDRGTLDHL